MERNLVLVLLGISTLSSFSGTFAQPPRIEVARPRVPENGAMNEPYWGTVTQLTKHSITIDWPKEEERMFLLSEALAAGKVPREPRPLPKTDQRYYVNPTYMYRIADVKVGDLVSIRYARVGDVYICDHVCIDKRPGGLVPPLPEEAEELFRGRLIPGRTHIRYHERMNAHWDLEERGIPYPEKFGKYRRFPAAPAPREVKPKP